MEDMFEIARHIEYLLSIHNRVSLPGWGVFVWRCTSASFDRNGFRCLPPSDSLVFENEDKTPDDLLVRSVMRAKSIGPAEAKLFILTELKSLRKSLQANTSVVFGTLGRFAWSETGEPVFTANPNTMQTNSFGLMPVSLTPLALLQSVEKAVAIQQKQEEEPKKADTLYIPINRRFVRSVASIAAAILLLFMISTPVDHTNTVSEYAGLVTTELFSAPESTIVSSGNDEGSVSAPEQPAVEAVPLAIDVTPGRFDAESDLQSASAVLSDDRQEPVYYIIVSSLHSYDAAKQELKKMQRKGCTDDIRILQGAKKSRLYIASFSTLAEAQDYWNQMDKRRYPGVWIYNACRDR